VDVNVGKPTLPYIEEAHADRRANPFVKVEADEIRAEVCCIEWDLSP
jgi:hypothetical protein